MIVVKILRKYALQNIGNVLSISLLSLLLTALSIWVPLLEQKIIDDGVLPRNLSVLFQRILWFLLVYILIKVLDYCQLLCQLRMHNSMMLSLKSDIFNHAYALPLESYVERGFYKIVSGALFDADNVLDAVEDALSLVFSIGVRMFGAIIALFMMSWKLAILTILFVPIKVFINRIIQKKVEEEGNELIEESKKSLNWVNNCALCIREIKLWCLKGQFIDGFRTFISNINIHHSNVARYRQFSVSLVHMLDTVVSCVLYIAGTKMLQSSERITIGTLLTFISYSVFLQSPVNIILQIILSCKQSKSSLYSLNEFFSLPLEVPGKSLAPTSLSSIVFENVYYSVGGSSIINNANFNLENGDKVVIIGDNGSGKTTLLNIILKVVKPTSGTVFVNDVDINEFDIETYRKMFSVVSQSVSLPFSTIKDNISLGQDVNIDKFLEDYQCYLGKSVSSRFDSGKDGSTLSGGERRKIAFMRALFNKRPVLILDEVDANIDADTRSAIYSYLMTTKEYDLIIVVTHNLDYLDSFNVILSIESGSIQCEKKGRG